MISSISFLAFPVAHPLFTKLRPPNTLFVTSVASAFFELDSLGLWLFYGFMPGPKLMGMIGPVWLLPIWFGEYVIQMWFAAAWLRRFRFGPAEWLWRSLNYSQIQPFRIAERICM